MGVAVGVQGKYLRLGEGVGWAKTGLCVYVWCVCVCARAHVRVCGACEHVCVCGGGGAGQRLGAGVRAGAEQTWGLEGCWWAGQGLGGWVGVKGKHLELGGGVGRAMTRVGGGMGRPGQRLGVRVGGGRGAEQRLQHAGQHKN